MKILRLSLHKLPFDIMKTGDKKLEFRKPSKWIMSRLVDKNGEPKHYDYVEFTNGYGADKPKFMAEYKGFEFSKTLLPATYHYTNGLSVVVSNGDVIIELGDLYEKK